MTIAVFDTGKTNLKLSAATQAGRILETRATANLSHDGPPYRHIDLAAAEAWFARELKDLARRHEITHVVVCGHGSGGVLVDESGAVMPMIDYEGPCPEAVAARYPSLAGGFLERGSAIMQGAMHLARQMLWLETGWPEAFAAARHYLAGPQYWAFRLSGRPASEVTSLAAQSHLWDVLGRRFTPIVENRNWRRYLPDLVPAWETLGPLRPDFGLGPTPPAVLCGIHDSSANFYRYQRAGLKDFAVVSTGTWIVALADRVEPSRLSEARGMTLNADVNGHPVAGALVMGGREYGLLAGEASGPVDTDAVADLVARKVLALPSFVEQDGLFPGSGGRGRIAGDMPAHPAARRALALLYIALLTDALLDALGADGLVVLDGSFVAEPLFAALVAALAPDRDVAVNAEGYGAAAGAALLASHAGGGIVPLALERPQAVRVAGLQAYRESWRASLS